MVRGLLPYPQETCCSCTWAGALERRNQLYARFAQRI